MPENLTANFMRDLGRSHRNFVRSLMRQHGVEELRSEIYLSGGSKPTEQIEQVLRSDQEDE